MFEIRLETANGDYVITGIIPPFQTLPEVVIWGERVFRLASDDGEATPVYREVFFVAVVQTRLDGVAFTEESKR